MFLRSVLRTIAICFIAVGLVFATSLQADAATPPTNGIYTINKVLYSSTTWRLTITTIAVAGPYMNVSVKYQNLGQSPAKLYCPPADPSYITVSTRKVSSVTSYCSSRKGVTWSVPGGSTEIGWAIFPVIPDNSKSFSLTWYSWGTATGISLPSRIVPSANLANFFPWLTACAEGRLNFDPDCRVAATEAAESHVSLTSFVSCVEKIAYAIVKNDERPEAAVCTAGQVIGLVDLWQSHHR